MAATRSGGVSRVVIGVDPQKRIDAVVVLDEAETVLAREDVRAHLGWVPDTDGVGPPVSRSGPGRSRAATVSGRTWLSGPSPAERGVHDCRPASRRLCGRWARQLGHTTDDADAYSIALVGLKTRTCRWWSAMSGPRCCDCCPDVAGAGRAAHPGGLPAHRELVILIPGGASRRLTATRARALLRDPPAR